MDSLLLIGLLGITQAVVSIAVMRLSTVPVVMIAISPSIVTRAVNNLVLVAIAAVLWLVRSIVVVARPVITMAAVTRSRTK